MSSAASAYPDRERTRPFAGSEAAAGTLSDAFRERVRRTPAREAYRQFEARTLQWHSYSWKEIAEAVSRWRAALQAENLLTGARVAILLPNCVEHVCVDQAALSLGLVPVPLHVVDNPGNLAFILADCGASVLVLDSAQRWSQLAPFTDQLRNLRRVVYLEGPVGHPTEAIERSADCWLTNSPRVPGGRDDQPPRDPNSLAAIVYTSGTTGRPKGVMLSHRNILSNIDSIMSVMAVRDDDAFLSFLPLSHTLERTVGYYLPMRAGASVAFARSVALLREDMLTIRPSILVSVPRIYERVVAVLNERIGSGRLRRWLFTQAVDLGWRRFQRRNGRSAGLPAEAVASASRESMASRTAFAVLDRLFGRPLRDRFGGRLRVAVTGGAPLTADVARPLLALGVPIVQGYGMTECSPVIASNTPEHNDPSTVGRALPGVEVRLGEQDELLARGENVMLGYWGRPEETVKVLDADGWMHTGDRAEIKDGWIRISGRLKDIIVTSTGEKVPPADLEAAIARDPLFEQVMVLGEQRPYLVAIIVLNRQRWEAKAQSLGLGPASEGSLTSAVAIQWVLERIAQLVGSFPRYATPRGVILSTEPWTVASGLITPTLKPKRAAIASRYAAEVSKLYEGH